MQPPRARDLPATTFLGADLTFGEIKAPRRSAGHRPGPSGIVKGDRVGIMLPNCPQYVFAVFAVLRLGAIVVNINPAYTPPEVVHPARLGRPDGADARRCRRLAGAALEDGSRNVVITSLAEYSPAATPPGAIAARSVSPI